MTGLPGSYAVRGARIDQVQPFAFDRGPIGCVLLHGFTAAPKEMRPLGDYLAARNYTVRGVRYAGHGTSPQDLARTTQRDWAASADKQQLTLERGGHIVTEDYDKEIAFAAIERFLQQRSPNVKRRT